MRVSKGRASEGGLVNQSRHELRLFVITHELLADSVKGVELLSLRPGACVISLYGFTITAFTSKVAYLETIKIKCLHCINWLAQ